MVGITLADIYKNNPLSIMRTNHLQTGVHSTLKILCTLNTPQTDINKTITIITITCRMGIGPTSETLCTLLIPKALVNDHKATVQ
jgi:hypothetical protein